MQPKKLQIEVGREDSLGWPWAICMVGVGKMCGAPATPSVFPSLIIAQFSTSQLNSHLCKVPRKHDKDSRSLESVLSLCSAITNSPERQ